MSKIVNLKKTHCENTGPATRDHVKSSQMRNETTFTTLKAFPSCWNKYNISIF